MSGRYTVVVLEEEEEDEDDLLEEEVEEEEEEEEEECYRDGSDDELNDVMAVVTLSVTPVDVKSTPLFSPSSPT